MTTARENHAFFRGWHSFESNPAKGAFQIEWRERAWYYTDSRDGYARGPFTSSRAAFRAARLAYGRQTENMLYAPDEGA